MVTRASSVPSSINKTGERMARGTNKTIANAAASSSSAASTTTKSNRNSGGRSSSRNSNKKYLPRSRSLTNNNNNNGIRKPSPSPNLKGNTSKIQEKRNAPIVVRSRGNEIGSADTLEIIATKSTGSDEPSTPEDNINVVVRVRPLSDKERNENMVLQFPGNGQIMAEGRGSGNRGSQSVKLFTYNVVFEPGATQEDILEYSGIKRIVEMAVEGFSCTAFCYGQTGSGKTHTLTGPPELFIEKPDPADSGHGLIFRSFLYLFQMLKDRTETNFILKASFLEIYNEKVIDLLNPGSARKPLAVRWSKKSGGFFVENLFTVDCEELDDLLAVLEEGMRNRSVGSHQMNEHSSRSHTILTVHIISEQQAENGVFLSKHGKINFVDLAGSEMTKKTLSEGKLLEEANNINKSLMVLGYCIASLSDSKKRTGHIPYRDSQLTKLLADSLAGNGVTLMIACVAPSDFNYTETLNTLRYASRAKRIRTKPIIIMDPREALILNLKRDINVLQIENEHLKTALNLSHESTAASIGIITPNAAITDINYERQQIPQAPEVSLEKLAQLEGSELAELVKLYMQENQSLREENSILFTAREVLLRDQELVSRENERLLKKLEDVNRVCVRSPLITGPASGQKFTNSNSNNNDVVSSSLDKKLSSSDIWTNPYNMEQLNASSMNAKVEIKNNNNKNKQIGENILEIASQFGIGESPKSPSM